MLVHCRLGIVLVNGVEKAFDVLRAQDRVGAIPGTVTVTTALPEPHRRSREIAAPCTADVREPAVLVPGAARACR